MRTKKYKSAGGIGTVLCMIIICLTAAVSASADYYTEASAAPAVMMPEQVYIGGMPFGVRFFTEGVIIAGLEDVKSNGGDVCPAKDAGLMPKDVIMKINGESATSSEMVIGAITSSGGNKIKLTYKRGGSEHEAVITPVAGDDGIYRAGMWIRDNAAGIGTVTYYNGDSGEFAGLGHGICDTETGELMPLSKGIVTNVSLCGINRGKAGAPGELKGYFNNKDIGTLTKNTRCGVYGILTRMPQRGELIDVAGRGSVKAGDVKIRCTLHDGETREYDAVISEINKKSEDNKSFIITVTDRSLIEATGGIVQGMSGSPIIQNGALIGAVTHVMINDPTRGYGIFIENMMANAAAK